MEKQNDAKLINEIMNHPDVRRAFDVPSMEGKPLDFTNFINNPNNIGLVWKGVCCIFKRVMAGLYECHFAALPEYRGKRGMPAALKAFEYVFTQTDAIEVITKCKVDDVASNAGARSVKFQEVLVTRPMTESSHGLVSMRTYSMTIQNWAVWAPGLVEQGHAFHDKIKALHDNDDVHNRYVGGAMLMLYGGQHMKAIGFYNRGAIMSGYRPIKILSTNPFIVDIIEAKIQINGNDFEVIP